MRTIGFGSIDGRYVFMDERTDSYFSIEPALHADVDEVVENGGLLRSNDRLRSRLHLGDEPVRIVRGPAGRATRCLVEGFRPSRARLSDVIRAAGVVRRTRAQLRACPIERILHDAATHGSEPCSHDQLIDRALRFMAARRFVPSKPNCLLDSLALVRWLGGAGKHVSILFGVKLDPFAAHCWLQSGALLLNDQTESVAAFTVVRAIRC